MVVGVLGILKAGGAYVPLDPAYPRERLAYMLDDTKAPVILTQEKLRANLPRSQADIVCLDRDWPTIAKESVENLAGTTNGDSLAYVIYTSGSTGRPKGACVPHRGIVRLVKNTNYVHLDANQVFLQFAPISFDASTFELWGCLLNGARLVIFPPARPSLQQLGEAIEKHRVTILWLTAALFHHMVENCCDKLKGVRQLLAGGDVLPIGAVRKVLTELKGTRLINGYGPTENTTFTCCHAIAEAPEAATSVPIGRPIANTTAYILDRHLQPAPIGVPGELWTGGDGLATCYLHHPELTAERFRPDPFSGEPGARMYRTGDLVRWLPDGTIEFFGRIDQQVKIRGFRIELGEIETVLAQHPAVRDVAVIAREDTPGDKRLVAYVVLKPEANGTIDHPRQFVKQRLPEYMVPSAVVVMDALPLSPAGKVDRRNLPRPERLDTETGAGFVAARTLTEEVAVGIWEDVLKADCVGVHDNFFELGGDSLLATVTAVRLGRALNVEVPASLVFDKPTLAELCAAVDQLRMTTRGETRPPITSAPRDCPLPLSFFQERIWEYSQATPDPLRFRTIVAMDLLGPLDVDLFRRSLEDVMRRHEVLRTTIGVEDGRPVQIVHEPFAVPVIDVADETELKRLTRQETNTPIDLVRGPLMRLTIMRLSPERHHLFMSVHHLIYDGSLREIFFEELSVVYQAFRDGNPSPLPELPIQYGDFAAWQRKCLDAGGGVFQKQMAFWRKQLSGDPSSVQLPFARPKPAEQNLADAKLMMRDWFPAGLCGRLEAFSQREGTTLFMTLLAGFKICLHQATGQEDLVVGTYLSSRGQPELDRVIGLKTNLVALRTNLAGRPTFREVLRRVRTTTLDAYAHQDVLYHQVEQTLPTLGVQAPRIEAILQHVKMSKHPFVLPDVEVNFIMDSTAQVMPWGFSLNFIQYKDQVTGGLAFDTDRYDPQGVRRMMSGYLRVLEDMIANPERGITALKTQAA
jgi:amino acid adenylation domain-containing protein